MPARYAKKIRILSVETSCDETAVALLECSGGLAAPKFKILKDTVASQIAVHQPFGGVVPNLAKREHLKNLPILFKKLFGAGTKEAAAMKDVDLIAVTSGPGLEPALWTGIEFSKTLAKKYTKPLVGANHLEGHLYSFLLPKSRGAKSVPLENVFPSIGLIVSGGHTALLVLESLKERKKIGETRDDAVGEAFDKVARILRLPYPGGPEIEKLAPEGNPSAVPLPRPMLNQKNYDFSFSGLKTSVLYYFREHPDAPLPDLAASFQAAAVEVLVAKAMRAAKEFGAKSLCLSGGVAANKALREALARETKQRKMKFFVADFKHNTDNAVMIAAAAYLNHCRSKKYPLVANGAMNIR